MMHVLRWQMLINQQQAYRYQISHEWVERDLIELDHIPTALNQADHFKKSLPRILFHRNYIMGHVPPPHTPLYNKLRGTSNTLNRTTATAARSCNSRVISRLGIGMDGDANLPTTTLNFTRVYQRAVPLRYCLRNLTNLLLL